MAHVAGDRMKRLNIGCGPVQPDGWENIDVDPGYPPHRYRLMDPAGHNGLDWPAATFDGAVSHHVLQMVPWPDLVPWLEEVRRVLKPGAVLRLSVPDLLGAVGAYLAGDRSWFPIDPAHEESTGGALCMYLTQAGATRSVFTASWLAELFDRAGFAECSWSSSENGVLITMGPPWLVELDNRHAESIYVEGRA